MQDPRNGCVRVIERWVQVRNSSSSRTRIAEVQAEAWCEGCNLRLVPWSMTSLRFMGAVRPVLALVQFPSR